MNSLPEHEGFVVSVDTHASSIRVRLLPPEKGCDGCAAASLCGAPGGNIITLPTQDRNLREGMKVKLRPHPSDNVRSVILLLGAPLMLALLAFFVVDALTTERIAALIAFATLALWYAIVALLPSTRKNKGLIIEPIS